MGIREQLVGTYRLYDWKIVDGDKLLDATLGPMEGCHGMLIYTEDGYMSVWLSKKDRPEFASRAIDGELKKKNFGHTIVSMVIQENTRWTRRRKQ